MSKIERETMKCKECGLTTYSLIAIRKKKFMHLIAECTGCGKQDTLLISSNS